MKRTTTDARWTYCRDCEFWRRWDNDAKPSQLVLATEDDAVTETSCFRHAIDAMNDTYNAANLCSCGGWGCGEGAPHAVRRAKGGKP